MSAGHDRSDNDRGYGPGGVVLGMNRILESMHNSLDVIATAAGILQRL
jgi:hypothetical protein